MRRQWRLTADGDMDSWGDAPSPAPERRQAWDLLAWLAADPGSGIYEIGPGWYSSRPDMIVGPALGT